MPFSLSISVSATSISPIVSSAVSSSNSWPAITTFTGTAFLIVISWFSDTLDSKDGCTLSLAPNSMP